MKQALAEVGKAADLERWAAEKGHWKYSKGRAEARREEDLELDCLGPFQNLKERVKDRQIRRRADSAQRF